MSRTRGTRRANTARHAARRLRDVEDDRRCSRSVSRNGEACTCSRCVSDKNYCDWKGRPTLQSLLSNEWTRVNLSDYNDC